MRRQGEEVAAGPGARAARLALRRCRAVRRCLDPKGSSHTERASICAVPVNHVRNEEGAPVPSSRAMTMKFFTPAFLTASHHVASMPYLPSSEMRALFETGGNGSVDCGVQNERRERPQTTARHCAPKPSNSKHAPRRD